MNKALYCFKQASNEPFTKKAKIQLDSFNLRLKLFNAPRAGTFSDDKSRSKVEKEAVESSKPKRSRGKDPSKKVEEEAAVTKDSKAKAERDTKKAKGKSRGKGAKTTPPTFLHKHVSFIGDFLVSCRVTR